MLNRTADADFVPEDFRHVAVWNAEARRVEMRLRAMRPMRVRLAAADLELELDEGDEILTELCGKFNTDTVAADYADAGLELIEWHTDPEQRFAVTLARRAD